MSKETLDENLAIYDDLQTDTSFDLEARLLSSEGLSSSLPSISFASKATYNRDGDDLVLTLEGESVVVKNYFTTPNPPALTTMDGAVLTPAMVASFLQNGDAPNFYAHSWFKDFPNIPHTSLKTETIAIIQDLEGSVLVLRNGVAVTLQNGGQLLPGDEIFTSIDSSASMIFADRTLFKIGSEARIALDEFAFESSTSTGLQVLSILSGAFSYIGGLVAKNDPDDVQLRTPFGVIGIRGTKIVGKVDAENATARITLLEGHVLYTTPQGEEHEINQGFETLIIENGGDKVRETILSAERVARSYDVFENTDKVTEFLQRQPLTQQDDADEPLPAISYSQAQAELRALIVSDPNNALEGGSSADRIEQILKESTVNLKEGTLERKESSPENEADAAIEYMPDEYTESRYPGGTFDIPLTTFLSAFSNPFGTRENVLLDLTNYFRAKEVAPLYAVFNFQIQGSPGEFFDVQFFKGEFLPDPDQEHSSFVFGEANGDPEDVISWRKTDGAVITEQEAYSGAPLPPLDDLMIRIFYRLRSDSAVEGYYIFIGDYFKDLDNLPAYSISIRNGEPTPLEDYTGVRDFF